MMLALAIALTAAGAAPAAICHSAPERRAMIDAHLGDDQFMTRLSDMTVAAERRIRSRVDRLDLPERERARIALRLLASPELAVTRAATERAVDTVFERLDVAMRAKDEVALCGTLVDANAMLPTLAASAERQQRYVENRIEAETAKRLASATR